MSPGAKAQRIALIVTAVLLGAAVTIAWLVDAGTPDDVYSITVLRDGQTVADYDITALKGLEWRKVRMQGQEQEGPPLLRMLEDAGISEFAVVVVSGPGVRDDGRIELSAEDIDEDVLLDIAARGTAKLCGPEITWDDRVRDVHTIEVR